jgi:hypothetical protein
MNRIYYTYHIRITNRDRVQVERLGPQHQDLGQPSGDLRYKDKLEEIIPLLEIFREKDSLNNASQVRVLGEVLFDILFDNELRNNFVDFYNEVVHREEQFLRVELDIDESQMPELAALPWEFMCLPACANRGTLWIGTAPSLVFSRRRSLWTSAKAIPLDSHEKLKIALVISAPSDLDPVAYEEIKEALERLTNEQAHRVELLPIVSSANPGAIDNILLKKPHIFHFIGHGRWANDRGQEVGQIALVDPDLHDAMWVDTDYFSDLFNRHHPSIVMLQSCEGGMLSASQAFVGVASGLVQQDIPVTIAMQYEVSNSTAKRFVLSFYKQLAADDPVDIAAQCGRRAIALGPTMYKKRDFATPVIFTRVRDGYLFQSISSYQNSTSEAERFISPEQAMKDLNDSDRERLANLLQRSGQVDKVDSRRAFCISIRLNPSDIDFIEGTSASSFAKQLVSRLHDCRDHSSLCKLCQELVRKVPSFKTDLESIRKSLNCN